MSCASCLPSLFSHSLTLIMFKRWEQKEEGEPLPRCRKIILTRVSREIGKIHKHSTRIKPLTAKTRLQRELVSVQCSFPPPSPSLWLALTSPLSLSLVLALAPLLALLLFSLSPPLLDDLSSPHPFLRPFNPFQQLSPQPTPPSSSNILSLSFRYLTMEASVTHSPISPCFRRIWTPCRSVGLLTLMVPWWWVSAGPWR